MQQNLLLLPFLPFDQSLLDLEPNTSYLSFGFDECPPTSWQGHLTNITLWRPSFLKLTHAGFQCLTQNLPDKHYDGGFLQLSKHKGRNQQNFINLLKQVKPQGKIIICGDKNLGVQSMRKWVAQFFDIENSLSKYHGQCFWFTRPKTIDLQQFDVFSLQEITFNKHFTTTPGMFSHGRVDAGSQLLIDTIQDNIKGLVADFGAGWGFLSATLLEKYPKITQLDLYEADFEALKAAKNNLTSFTSSHNINYHWFDLQNQAIEQQYDWVISNPPFHEGRMSDSTIGQSFISKAFTALKPKGQLLLVANRQLPYEKLLTEKFNLVEKRLEQGGFKVIYARK